MAVNNWMNSNFLKLNEEVFVRSKTSEILFKNLIKLTHWVLQELTSLGVLLDSDQGS